MIKDSKKEVILSVPNADHVIAKVPGIPLLIRFSDYLEYSVAFKEVYHRNKQVRGAVIDYSGLPVSFMPVEGKEHARPVYIRAGGIGDFRFIIDLLPVLRKNFTFFFSADKSDHYRNALILSSLGINCGIELTGTEILWEEVESLGIHISRSLRANGHLFPFTYIRQHRDPQHYLDFNIPMLNSPLNYLHADEDLNIYLSREDMADRKPAGHGAEFVKQYPDSEIYREARHHWKNYFLTMTACSTCPAFRVCMGKFSENPFHMSHCKQCFSDFLNNLDKKENKERKVGIALIKP